jgi:hypothetical protein
MCYNQSMKNFILLLCLLTLSACSSPLPENPVLITDKVINTGEITDTHKTGPYTVAFFVETENYYVVSNLNAIVDNKNAAFGGPGTVNHFVVDSFRPLFKVATQRPKPMEMMFYGDLVLNKDDSPFLHRGKKVIYLHHASVNGKQYYIDRVRQ